MVRAIYRSSFEIWRQCNIIKYEFGANVIYIYIFSLSLSLSLSLITTFSISMYIMCVILCLFSALNRRVGALQMSIIIIIMSLRQCLSVLMYVTVVDRTLKYSTSSEQTIGWNGQRARL